MTRGVRWIARFRSRDSLVLTQANSPHLLHLSPDPASGGQQPRISTRPTLAGPEFVLPIAEVLNPQLRARYALAQSWQQIDTSACMDGLALGVSKGIYDG